ncbi:MAG: response regulator transcription factor [Planctomycetes bacterium]|nr:response regulator transcription factor [Planctomycetota bacterium]
MLKETILIIEDEPDIIEVIEYNFRREGYNVVSATNGEKGLEIARTRRPSAVILDLMLPGLDGIEVARRLRQDPATSGIAIVMLTAKGEESDIVLGLGVGADDYVVKPFRPKELLARVTTVLRRGPLEEEGPTGRRLERGGLVIDEARHQVTKDGKDIALTLTEFKLLAALAAVPGRVFTRRHLLDKIQGDAYVQERNIDVHIKSIRKKLGEETDCVVTVRGVGYKLKE